jgi:hypothetical protein
MTQHSHGDSSQDSKALGSGVSDVGKEEDVHIMVHVFFEFGPWHD